MKTHNELRPSRAAVVADYGLYSLTNFVLGIAVARVANLAVFGVFALLFQLCNFSLVMIRAALGETWLVTQTGTGPERTPLPTAFAFALGLGLVPVFVLVAALLTDLTNHLEMVLAMAAILPALIAQDTHRFVCFASRNPWRAVFSDTSWLVTQVATLVCMALGILPNTPAWAALAWTIGAYAGLLTIGARSHLRPGLIVPGFNWWRSKRRVGQHLAVETLGSSMVGPLIAIGLFMMGKDVALGVLRAASTLFSPILVFAQGMRTALTRWTAHDRLKGPRGARFLLATTSLVWGGVLFTAPSVGKIILGGLWGPSIRQIVLLEAAARIGLASAAIDSACLRKRAATFTAAAIGIWSGGLVVSAALLGSMVDDFFGAAVGTAAAYALGAAVWRYHCARTRVSSSLPG
ncbi:MAG: hypothetical protein WD627_01315 [Actinomycetota bacterium]